MGKQKKRNAFFFFMMDKKAEVEKRLQRSVAMTEMAQHVTREWNELPDSQKNKYRLMSGENRETMDCRGVPLRQLQEEAQDRRRQAEQMQRDIAEMVDMYHLAGALHQVTFFVVSTSYYVHTDHDQYVPAELGILQFSFKSGIIKEFHGIIKPIIPRSYPASARKHSQETHNLMQESVESIGMSSDEVAQSLKKFLAKDWSKDVPIYTLHEEINQTEQILETITGDEHKVYSLDMLFMHMFSATVRPVPLSVATEMITECSLDFYPNMSCMWHNTKLKDAARFCTVSCVRRWMYFMCQHIDLEKNFGVVPQEGKHYPHDMLDAEGLGSISSLSLEDTDRAQGAASFDSWPLVNGRGCSSTESDDSDFPPLGAQLPKKGKRGEVASGKQARSVGEVYPNLQLD